MNNELAQMLNTLHKEAETFRAEQKRASLQIGEALYTKRLGVSQREFTAWIRSNLEFDSSMANRYLAAFQKEEIKQWQGFDL